MAYDRNDVKGQALVHRAMNYFLLVNLYGKQYDAATASTDLGVPLVLEADINKQYPRATVAQVYERMLQDLNDAISLLKLLAAKDAFALRRTAARIRLKYFFIVYPSLLSLHNLFFIIFYFSLDLLSIC